MGRINEKHLRYRSKETIAQDVACVLSTPISYGTQFAVISEVCWVWTEFFGKYNGCPYWSKRAIEVRAANPKAKLKHEHVVPKRVVAKMLFDLKSPTQEVVRNILDKFLIGVVVTEKEDYLLNCEFRDSMPPEFFDRANPSYHDPWLRYKRCGIEVSEATKLIACE
jgi:hypothetical protein